MSHSVGQVGLPCGLRSIEHNTLVMFQLMIEKNQIMTAQLPFIFIHC